MVTLTAQQLEHIKKAVGITSADGSTDNTNLAAVRMNGDYLPPATAASKGAVKVGNGLEVTADGTLSVSGSSGTVTAGSTLVADANRDISGLHNVTMDGTLIADKIQGDMYASDGVSKILDPGTDGTDAVLTANVVGKLTGSSTQSDLTVDSIPPTPTTLVAVKEPFAVGSVNKNKIVMTRDDTGLIDAKLLPATSTYTNADSVTDGLMTSTHFNLLSGITEGSATAGKALVIDSSKDIHGINNMSVTNSLVAGKIQGTVYATNGVSVVLDAGTDGTDALLTADVVGNVTGNSTSTDLNVDGTVAPTALSAVRLPIIEGGINANKIVMTRADTGYIDSKLLPPAAAVVNADLVTDGLMSAADFAKLDVVNGVASANKAVVTDTANNITGLNDVTVNNILTASKIDSDVYASDKTSKILENGTDGTDAVFTGSVNGDGVTTILSYDTGSTTTTIGGSEVVVTGNLTINGTTTSVNTETMNLADNAILLNSNLTNVDVPTQDAGIEVNRGSQPNKSFLWNETDDRWSAGTEALHGATITDGVASLSAGALTGVVSADVSGTVTAGTVTDGVASLNGGTITGGIGADFSGVVSAGSLTDGIITISGGSISGVTSGDFSSAVTAPSFVGDLTGDVTGNADTVNLVVDNGAPTPSIMNSVQEPLYEGITNSSKLVMTRSDTGKIDDKLLPTTATIVDASSTNKGLMSSTHFDYLDGVNPGTSIAGKALVADGFNSLSGLNSFGVTGTVTAINFVGDLTGDVTGNAETANLTVDSAVGVPTILTAVSEPLSNGTGNSSKLVMTRSDTGLIDEKLIPSSAVTVPNANSSDAGLMSSAHFDVLDGVTPGMASASNAVILDASSNITNLGSVTAAQLTDGTTKLIGGEILDVVNITASGTVTAPDFVGDLTGDVTGNASSVDLTIDTAGAMPTTVLVAQAPISSGTGNSNKLVMTRADTGMIDPNLIPGGTTDDIDNADASTDGLMSSAHFNLIDGVTAGIASADKVLIVDNGRNLVNLASVTASTLTDGTATLTGGALTATTGDFSGDVSVGGNLNTTGSCVIDGDLTVKGTTTTISTEEIKLADNNITLNSNLLASAPPTEDCGITVNRGSQPSKSLEWKETGQKWSVGTEELEAGTLSATSLSDGTATLTGGALTGAVSANFSGDVTAATFTGSASQAELIVDLNAATPTTLVAVQEPASSGGANVSKLVMTRSDTGLIDANLLPASATIVNANSVTDGLMQSVHFDLVDGVTAGTASADKVLTVDANKDVSGIRNLTSTGTVTTTTLTDGTATLTGGIMTGATSITSTTFVGDLTGNADTATTATSVSLAIDADVATPISLVATQEPSSGGAGNASRLVMTRSDTGLIDENLLPATVGLATTTTDGLMPKEHFTLIDGVAAGTVSASQVVIVDANKDLTGLRNVNANDVTVSTLTDGTASLTGGVMTGATSITSTSFVGDLTGNADTATQAELTVDTDAAVATTLTAVKVPDVTPANNASKLVMTGANGLVDASLLPAAPGLANFNTDGLMSFADFNKLDVAVPGTAEILKAVIVDINQDIGGFRIVEAAGLTDGIAELNGGSLTGAVNVTSSGTVTAGTVTDGTATLTGGVMTGATSITSTSFVGDLTGNADTATQAELTVDADVAVATTLTAVKVPDVTPANNASKLVMTGANGLVDASLLPAAPGLANTTTDGLMSSGDFTKLDIASAGTVEAAKAVTVDLNKDVTGFRDITASGIITGSNVTDGTATMSSGSITGAVNVTASGTVTAGTFTDGTATLTGGALSGATTGGFSGAVTVGSLTDGVATISGGAISGATNITASGDLVLGGNLTVNGTMTTIETEEIKLADNQILLNSNLDASTAPTQNAGIEINRGNEPNKTFVWNETTDKWSAGSDELEAGTLSAATLSDGTATLSGGALSGAVTIDATTSVTAPSFVGELTGSSTKSHLAIDALAAAATALSAVSEPVASGAANSSKLVMTRSDTGLVDVNVLPPFASPDLATAVADGLMPKEHFAVIDGVTAGTASGDKAVILNASKNITGLNEVGVVTLNATTVTDGTATLTSGALSGATTGDFSGAVSVGSLTDGVATLASGALSGATTGDFSGTVTAPNFVGDLTGTADKALLTVDTDSPVSTTLTASSEPSATGAANASKLVMTRSDTGVIAQKLLPNASSSASGMLSANHFSNLDQAVDGTVKATKVVIPDANKDITGFRDLSATGTITAPTFAGDLSGNASTVSVAIDVNASAATTISAVQVPSTAGVANIDRFVMTRDTGFIDDKLLPTAITNPALASTTDNGLMKSVHFDLVDGVTEGSVSASKVVSVDANSDVAGFRNVTLTGILVAPTMNGDIIASNGTTILDNGTDGTDAVFTGSIKGDASTTILSYNSGSTTTTISGVDVVIPGNLTVQGTTTSVTTATLNVENNSIQLNSTLTGTDTPTQNAVIEVNRGSQPNKSITWDETADQWTVGSETFVAGNITDGTASLSGGALTGATNGTFSGTVTAPTFSGDLSGNADTVSVAVDALSAVATNLSAVKEPVSSGSGNSSKLVMTRSDTGLIDANLLPAVSGVNLSSSTEDGLMRSEHFDVLDGVIKGTASSNNALVVDASNNIGNIGTLTATSLTDGTATLSAGALSGATSVTATTLTDGTASLSAGALSGATTGDFSGVVTAGTLTDGVATLTGGVISNAASGSFSGSLTAGTVTDGTASLSGGVMTGATSITSTSFVGDLTGDVTGDLTGNADTASQVSLTVDLGSASNTTLLAVKEPLTSGATNASKIVMSRSDTGLIDSNLLPSITSYSTATTTDNGLMSSADFDKLDIAANGTVEPNKTLIADANKDISGLRNLTASAEISGGSLTDGTATLSGGALSGATTATFNGTVTAGTVTDGTASLSGGALSGATTGNFSGAVTAGSVTDGTATLNGGALSGATTGTFSGAVSAGSLSDGVATITGGALSGATTGTFSGSLNSASLTTTADVVIGGNLTVSGTTTTINTEELKLADNQILLNSNLDGLTAPSQNAGIEINRGSESNKSLVWNETTDRWTVGAEEFEAGVITSTALTDGTATLSSGALSGATTGAFSTSVTAPQFIGELVGSSTQSHLAIDNLVSVATDLEVVRDPAAGGSANGNKLVMTDATTGLIDPLLIPSSLAGDITGDVLAADTTVLVDSSAGSINLNGTMKDHMIPDLNATHDIGSASKKIRHLFLSDNSLKIGDDVNVSVNGNRLEFTLTGDVTGIKAPFFEGDTTGTAALATQAELIVDSASAAATTLTAVQVADVTPANNASKLVMTKADGKIDSALLSASTAELEGVVAGTVSASKCMIVDADKDITGGRNLTVTGALTGGALTDGTLLISGGGISSASSIASTKFIGDVYASDTSSKILDAGTDGTDATFTGTSSKVMVTTLNSGSPALTSESLVAVKEADSTALNNASKLVKTLDTGLIDSALVPTMTELEYTVDSTTGTAAVVAVKDAASNGVANANKFVMTNTAGEIDPDLLPIVSDLQAGILPPSQYAILSGVSAGTIYAEKAVVTNANKDIGSSGSKIRHLYASGDITASKFTDGTLTIQAGLINNATQIIASGSVIAGSITCSNDCTIGGSLTVNGTTTFVNTEEINLADNVILLNSNLGSGDSPSENSGIEINRGSEPNKFFRWMESVDKWSVGANDTLKAGTFEGDLSGTASQAELTVDSAAATATTLTAVQVADVTPANNASKLVMTKADGKIDSSLYESSSPTELDGITAGIVTAEKAVVVDANKDIGDFRNVTATTFIGALNGNADTATQATNSFFANNVSMTVDGVNLTGSPQVVQVPDSTPANNANKFVMTGTGGLIDNTLLNVSTAELDGVTPGTVTASKAMVVDADKDITGGRNFTVTGTLTGQAIVGTSVTDGTATMVGGTLTGLSSVTSTAFVGDLTGDVTGNADTASAVTINLGGGSVNSAINAVKTADGTASNNANKFVMTETDGFIDSALINITPTQAELTIDSAAPAATTLTAVQVADSTASNNASKLVMTETDGYINDTLIEKFDGVSNGTVTGGKAILVGGSKNIFGFNDMSGTGKCTWAKFVGPVFAADNQTRILKHGTDGTDAQFTGQVIGNVTGNADTATQAELTIDSAAATPTTLTAVQVADGTASNNASKLVMTGTDGLIDSGLVSTVAELDGAIAGTVVANKVVIAGSSNNVTGFNNLSGTGRLTWPKFVGDVYAADNTSKILDHGTDGTDATFTGTASKLSVAIDAQPAASTSFSAVKDAVGGSALFNATRFVMTTSSGYIDPLVVPLVYQAEFGGNNLDVNHNYYMSGADPARGTNSWSSGAGSPGDARYINVVPDDVVMTKMTFHKSRTEDVSIQIKYRDSTGVDIDNHTITLTGRSGVISLLTDEIELNAGDNISVKSNNSGAPGWLRVAVYMTKIIIPALP